MRCILNNHVTVNSLILTKYCIIMQFIASNLLHMIVTHYQNKKDFFFYNFNRFVEDLAHTQNTYKVSYLLKSSLVC